MLGAACGGDTGAPVAAGPLAQPIADTRVFQELEDFVSGGYWNRPIPPQGEAPEGWSTLEASLAPEQCGTCHVDQFADWQTTVHSDAYSPGLSGQLVGRQDFAFERSCLRCHAPLSEQNAQLSLPEGGFGTNPDFDPALKRQGMVCAACHARGHRIHGPPRRDGSMAPSEEGMPHGGVTRTTYFEDSRFCAGCHQFAAPAPNGKSLQNTYEEWLASRYADEGVSCQSCHMPDRRHLWRGIHDPEMVKSGVTIEWLAIDETGRVTLQITNTGTGHRFPTYVTPAVDVSLEFLDGDGDVLAGERTEATIGREVASQNGTWVELSDTRLAPDSALTLSAVAPADAASVRGSVRVRPDAFYRTQFEIMLRGTRSDTSRTLIEAAHAGSVASPFTIFDDTLPIRP